MHPHKTLSSYLVRPDLTLRRQRNWTGFRTKFIRIRRSNPRLTSRLLVALGIWTTLGGSINAITSIYQQGGAQHSSGQAATISSANLQPGAGLTTLTTVAHANTLPSGPSGQLLPPGVLAPDRTYANNYVRGQCTWYVAGRRQVPNGWGNAVSWYYHATASGWGVGPAPAVAAIAWTPSGWAGHVALVEQVSADGKQVYISEMNYRGVGIKSYRWVAVSAFKYIY